MGEPFTDFLAIKKAAEKSAALWLFGDRIR